MSSAPEEKNDAQAKRHHAKRCRLWFNISTGVIHLI
jgi:hypothetical protein